MNFLSLSSIPRFFSHARPPLIVSLTDLSLSHTVLDFEVVPPLRSVIVLDDIALPELEYDEPWEHVYASDASSSSEDSEGPTATRMDTNKPVSLTYAKIAALN
ncbi:hypothetical protein H0H93_009587 [Arthromyces matolae]|nr:hypothetical protein H0H93_009587 [Arthromyces matolae]